MLLAKLAASFFCPLVLVKHAKLARSLFLPVEAGKYWFVSFGSNLDVSHVKHMSIPFMPFVC